MFAIVLLCLLCFLFTAVFYYVCYYDAMLAIVLLCYFVLFALQYAVMFFVLVPSPLS